ncbi:MAG: hypothetical protein PHQ54_05690, partial [Candidatus Omnitrophica bacterium]|nr:hypothetical protein [Candidatus Omnitrophota bacterium]
PAANIEAQQRLEALWIDIYSFLKPDQALPSQMPTTGEFYPVWRHWITWRLGETSLFQAMTRAYTTEQGSSLTMSNGQTVDLANRDAVIRSLVDARIAEFKNQYGEFEVTRQMRQDLEYTARRELSYEMLRSMLGAQPGQDPSATQIVGALSNIYTGNDIAELERLFDFFKFFNLQLRKIVDLSELYPYYSIDAGFIVGTVLSFRKEVEEELGANFMDRPEFRERVVEEFNILAALKIPIERLLGRPLNLFHPDGNDFGFLRGFSSQVDGGLNNPPSEVLTTPVWKLGTLAEKRTLGYVINQRIPRWTFLRGILERAYGHEYDIVRDSSDINLIAHWNTCMETYGWTEYTVMKKLIPNVGSSIAGAVRGFFGGFNWDNMIVRNEPVSLAGSEQPIDLNSGNTVNVDIPEGSQNWRHYAYLRFYVNTEVSDADSIVVTIRNADGEVAEYTVDITALPRARRAEVVIPIRRYIVDDNGNGIRDVIAWDGFIGNDSWKSYVSTDLDSNTELSGITDFSRILSWSLQSVGGYVKIEL